MLGKACRSRALARSVVAHSAQTTEAEKTPAKAKKPLLLNFKQIITAEPEVKSMYNKYSAKKTIIDGIKFDSKAEAERYRELKLLERAGKITALKRQVKFELIPKQADERAVYYIADFTYEVAGETIAEDVKGYKTKEYIIKRKLFKSLYPSIKFIESK